PQLFNTILINVTGFFRDAAAWDFLATEVVPLIIAEKKPSDLIRVWSAGCASGEEAYTLSIILAEALGFESFRQRVKIYATDVDEEALLQARQASYSAKDLQPIPDALRSKYFEFNGQRYVFRPDLRRSVIFGRHDLVQDAPISRLDLLVCRNVLMYFNAETQSRIMARFHFALNDPGYLFLGKAEMMMNQSHLFRPAEMKYRIFHKLGHAGLRDRLLILAQANGRDAAQEAAHQVRVRDLAFDLSPVPQIVVDAKGALALANDAARRMWRLTAKEIGR